MAGMAQGLRKLVEDAQARIKALRAAGKVEEAVKEEAALARTIERQGGVDASDWGVPLKSEPIDLSARADKSDWGVDATQWDAPLDTSAVRNKGKMGVMTGTGLAAAGLGLSGDTRTPGGELPPEQPSLLTPVPKPEEAQSQAMAKGPETKAVPDFNKVAVPAIKNVLAGLAEPESQADLTDWQKKMDVLTTDRGKLVGQFKNDIATAVAAADASTSSLEKRELLETITNAIGQIATGMYGLQTGLDLSGAKFQRTDWNAKLDRVRAELNDRVARLSAQQGLDQAVINEKKDVLMQEKDNLLRKYENHLRQWSAKAQLTQAKQGFETNKAQMKAQVDMFNAEQQRRMDEAMKKAAEKNGDVKAQISAGLKQADMDKKELEKQWNALAVRAGDAKLSDEQRAAIVQDMESLDRRYTELNGYPLLPAVDEKGRIASLETQDYSQIAPDEMYAKMQTRFKSVDQLKKAVASFQNPDREIQAVKDTYVAQPDAYIARFAQEFINANQPPNIAFKMAREKYRMGLQNMIEMEAEYRKYQSSLYGGAAK